MRSACGFLVAVVLLNCGSAPRSPEEPALEWVEVEGAALDPAGPSAPCVDDEVSDPCPRTFVEQAEDFDASSEPEIDLFVDEL